MQLGEGMKNYRIIIMIIFGLIIVGSIISVLYKRILATHTTNQEFQAGDFTYQNRGTSMKQGVKSDTDTFAIDGVALELFYGFYESDASNYDGAYMGTGTNTVLFAVYVCDSEEALTIYCPMEFDDYRLVDNHIFIREIPYEEAFSGDYGYSMDKKGITYKHHEQITIPSDVFTEEKGEFEIQICSFKRLDDVTGYVTATGPSSIKLRYEKVDAETVRILFD